MKIVYLAAGAAGMYCGSCLHDNTLAAALLRAGHDVLLTPTYTPLRTDEEDVSTSRVFLGGVNVYLQQKYSLFRHTPSLIDALFDSRAVMGWLANRRASVDPARLGDLTVSMIAGEEGNQRKEVGKLVRWLADEARPDVVHISNAMLLGLARPIAAELGVPVVCTLSGEDVFLERLAEPHYSGARELLKDRARHAAAFVAMNRYFAEYMTKYLEVDTDRVHVIPHGLNLDGHGGGERTARNDEFTIGYLARICPDKGLHLLARAVKLLADDPALPPLRLRAAGYLGEADRAYLDEIRQQLAGWGLADRFDYAGELDREEKIAFLSSLDCFSVPTIYRESKGISILEALANGVPVVLPAHGAFPELIEDVGGGLLFSPGDPAALAEALKRMIQDPDFARDHGRRGKEAVHAHYHADAMARRTLELYQRLMAPDARLISHDATR